MILYQNVRLPLYKVLEDRCKSTNKKIDKLNKIVANIKTGAKKKIKEEREKSGCEDKLNTINKEIEYYKIYL